MENHDPYFFSVRQFASKLGVHPNTVRIAIRKGLISTLRLASGKTANYRIPHSELERLSVVNLENILEKE